MAHASGSSVFISMFCLVVMINETSHPFVISLLKKAEVYNYYLVVHE